MIATTDQELWKQKHSDIAMPISEEVLKKLPGQNVLVQGVTLDFTLPSEGRLRVHGVRRIEGKEFKEDIGITIAPERYKNKFKNERRRFYRILKDNAFKLGKGEGARNLYLIPLENIPEFLEAVKEIEKDFQELQGDINAYLSKQTTSEEIQFLENVYEYIEQQSEVFQGVSLNYEIELSFEVSLMPLRIDTATFKEIINDQVTQEVERSLEQLEVEFARTRKKIIERMISDLNHRFSEILKRLAEATETKYAPRYKTMKTAIEKTVRLAETQNLEWLVQDLANAIDATALVLSEKEFGQKEFEKATKLIAKALNLDENDEPTEILWKAQLNLEAMDERTRALIERM